METKSWKMLFAIAGMAFIGSGSLCVNFYVALSTEKEKSKQLSFELQQINKKSEKLEYILSLERGGVLSDPVKKLISEVDDHLFTIKDSEKEAKFSRCMMKAMAGQTGSMGYYVDLGLCGDLIDNKSTLALFEKIRDIEVAPECDSATNQSEFNLCRGNNEDHSAKGSIEDILFRKVTGYKQSEMFSIASGQYNKYW